MKIHTLANPPPGLTFIPLNVEEVKIIGDGECVVRFKVVDTGMTVTVPFDFDDNDELPFPGVVVNVSFWVQT